MSFLKRIKEGLTSPKARISLQFNKNDFNLGENAEGTITITSEEEFDVKEIRCELQCIEETRKTKSVYDAATNQQVLKEVQESGTLYSAKPSVSGPLRITKGFSRTFPLGMNIPISGRPTFKSIDSKVTWFAKGAVAVDGRPDITTPTVEIQITQSSATPVIREKEIVREVVMIPCRYCGALMPQTDTACPHCGARRTA